jgi:4-amino-4-deoxy-L-arabinose transferase-like glycosyltransferase
LNTLAGFSNMNSLPPPFQIASDSHRLLRRVIPLIACAALVWMLAARVLGPSDLWDQTQYKTVSYTTDIIVNGGWHWILPVECGVLPATKPPLYNWAAYPFVYLGGFESELAHRAPSIIAFIACWLVILWLGQRIDTSEHRLLGWVAASILPANYTMFKLGYLARPDMMLTLWLTLAWIFATQIILSAAHQARTTANQEQQSSRLMALGFWTCIALAFLTKGPGVIVAVVYAALATRLIGSWRHLRELHLAWGLTANLLIAGAWLFAVWCIDPNHLREQLFFNEFLGRITGLGPEGGGGGWQRWHTTLPNQLFYFGVRFVPWSACALAAIAMLSWTAWKARRRSLAFDDQTTASRKWLWSAALYVGVVVFLYTLSAGKRADYIAAAFPPASILAAWCLTRTAHRFGHGWIWTASIASIIALAVMTSEYHRQLSAPSRSFGRDVARFVAEAGAAISADPLPVYVCWNGENHLQAMFGVSCDTKPLDVVNATRVRQPFWIVAGRKPNPPYEFDQWLLEQRPRTKIEVIVRSVPLAKHDRWPEQVTLYKVTTRKRTKSPKR